MQPGLGGGGAAGGDDVAAAVGEEGHGEGGAGVELLSDEDVAVVEGCGGDLDDEVVGFGGGVGDVDEFETVGKYAVLGGWNGGGGAERTDG